MKLRQPPELPKGAKTRPECRSYNLKQKQDEKSKLLDSLHQPEKPEFQIFLSFCIFYGYARHALKYLYTPQIGNKPAKLWLVPMSISRSDSQLKAFGRATDNPTYRDSSRNKEKRNPRRLRK